jgi:site-specific recombinase XerD
MRTLLLKDSATPSKTSTLSLELGRIAANDTTALVAPAPIPAETYLLNLAEGSRRTMSQALDTIAETLKPGCNATTIDWATVGYGEVARVRSALTAKYSPATSNKMLAALRGVMKATFRLGLIDADQLARSLDFRRVRGQRVGKGRALDTVELSNLLGACDRSSTRGSRNAAILVLGFGCGLRRAEVVGLDLADLIENGTALRVRGKGNKERIVYLPEGAQAHLTSWLERRGNHQGALLCAGSAGKEHRLSEQTIYDVVALVAKKAGVSKVAPHDLRRSFVCTLLDQGVSLSTVSAMAGHSDVSTTARYDRRGERAKREATKLLNVATLAIS